MTPSELLKIDVNGRTEKKNGLTYLSWAWAWSEVLKADPNANYEVQHFDGKPYLEVNGTAMVVVAVTVNGIVRTCHLPVMNSKNQPISIDGRRYKDKYGNEQVERIDSFNVNTAIMRCLTKGIAMHGLGLYIYAGEDLPMDADPEPAKVMPVDKKTGEVKGEVQLDTGNAEANSKLFAESMIKYSTLVKDLKDLNSYWKANQGQLEKLKADHPDLYENVRSTFTAIKQQFSQPKE